MTKPRRLRWGVPEPPPPKHPYRDTLIVYGAFAVAIVIVAWLTGGGVGRAVIVAAVFYVAACSWSFYRWRGRLREEAARAREAGE
jgi:hypothetical protein